MANYRKHNNPTLKMIDRHNTDKANNSLHDLAHVLSKLSVELKHIKVNYCTKVDPLIVKALEHVAEMYATLEKEE